LRTGVTARWPSLLLLVVLTTGAPVYGLTIEEVDTSFFPKVILRVSLEASKLALNDKLQVQLVENGRIISAMRVTRSPKDSGTLIISYLSSARGQRTHSILIRIEDKAARATFKRGKGRGFGHRRKTALEVRTIGPDKTHVPCSMTILDEKGAVIDDLTSFDGRGIEDTGSRIHPGMHWVELRLVGLDVPIDHFSVEVAEGKTTSIVRSLGFLELPGLSDDIAHPALVHIDIERLPSCFPSIRGNLARILTLLPKQLPPNQLPLPEGRYRIRLSPSGLGTPSIQPRQVFLDVYPYGTTWFPKAPNANFDQPAR